MTALQEVLGLVMASCLNLLALAVLLWVVATCLEIFDAAVGLPPNARSVVLVLTGVFGLIAIFSGRGISWF